MKIIDMHCDTIYEILAAKKRGDTMSLRDGKLMVNLEKMKQSGYWVQNFALFVEQEPDVSSFAKANDLLAIFKKEMKTHGEWISQVTTVHEMLENERAGKLSALLTIEGGEAIEGNLDNLRYFYEQGVRMMALTWNFPNAIGYPNFRCDEQWNVPDTENGLTEFGIRVLEEMEHLGMIVDVSHLSDAGFYDMLKYTEKPFVASHSNARSVCSHVRNLTDDMIRRIAERGGVIGLNYHSKFLADEYNTEKNDINHILEINMSTVDNEKTSQVVLEQLVQHAKHIIDIGGIECLGLGSDFDGIPVYLGMPKLEEIWRFADTLQRQGFHGSEIDKIFYQNVFRIYRDVLG